MDRGAGAKSTLGKATGWAQWKGVTAEGNDKAPVFVTSWGYGEDPEHCHNFVERYH